MKFLEESENNEDIDDDQRDTQGSKDFPVSWYQWQECKNSLGYCNLSKVLHDGNISQLYEEFTNVLPQFIQHSFIKRKQAQSYEECKLKVNDNSSLCSHTI